MTSIRKTSHDMAVASTAVTAAGAMGGSGSAAASGYRDCADQLAYGLTSHAGDRPYIGPHGSDNLDEQRTKGFHGRQKSSS
jgi:hypothetical protein